MNLIDLAERRWLPDRLVRAGMRRVIMKRLRSEARGEAVDIGARQQRFVDDYLVHGGCLDTPAGNGGR